MSGLRVYVGWDSREQEAYAVAEKTARAFGCDVFPVYETGLRAAGLLTRPVDHRGGMWDLASSAPQSTEFAISRFFVPLLAHSGWCLGVDCDVVFLGDPQQLLAGVDGSQAVYVVKHGTLERNGTKMDGCVQIPYPCKNWSSVVLWNVSHPANRRLNLTTLNQWPGRDLHAFKWLADSEIGELPAAANWLVNVQPKPENPIIAHYTEGGPWINNWSPREHDDIWTTASER